MQVTIDEKPDPALVNSNQMTINVVKEIKLRLTKLVFMVMIMGRTAVEKQMKGTKKCQSLH